MKYNTLYTIIDDIMLEMRNNNITESESYSRKQIEQWIIQHRASMIRELFSSGIPISKSFIQEFYLNLSKQLESSIGNAIVYVMLSDEKIPDIVTDTTGKQYISSYDTIGNEIQIMPIKRNRINIHSRHHYSGKTNAWIGVDGKYHLDSMSSVSRILFQGVFVDPCSVPGFDYGSDMYPIDPALIPELKKRIFASELKFNLFLDTKNDGRETYSLVKNDK